MKMSAKGCATSRADSAPPGLEPQVGVVVHPEPGQGGQSRVDGAELARVDAGPQDRLDPSLVLPTTLAELLGSFAGQGRELVQEDPHVVGIAVDDVEQFVAKFGELGRRRPTGSAPPVRHRA